MKLFLIEAYGGPQGTDGHIRHFTVRADGFDDALALVRESPEGQRFKHFDLIEELLAILVGIPLRTIW